MLSVSNISKRAREELQQIREKECGPLSLKRFKVSDQVSKAVKNRHECEQEMSPPACANLLNLANDFLDLQREQQNALALLWSPSAASGVQCHLFIVQKLFAILANADDELSKANQLKKVTTLHQDLKNSCTRTINSAFLLLVPPLSSEAFDSKKLAPIKSPEVDDVCNSVVDTLLLIMKRHGTSFSVQTEALKLLHRFLMGTDAFCARLHLSEEHQTVLDHLNEQDRMAYFWYVKGPYVIVETMRTFSSSNEITYMGLKLLQLFLSFSLNIQKKNDEDDEWTSFQNREQLDSFYGTVTEACIRALSYHKRNSRIQTIGWSVLAILSEHLSCRRILLRINSEIQMDTTVGFFHNVVDWVVSFMGLHIDNCNLQCNMTAVLCWLLHVGDGDVVGGAEMNDTATIVNKTHAVELNAQTHVPTLVQVMKVHLESTGSSSIFRNCVCLLCGTEASFGTTALRTQQQDSSGRNTDTDCIPLAILSIIIEGMQHHVFSRKVQEGCLQWLGLFLNRQLQQIRRIQEELEEVQEDYFRLAMLQKIVNDGVPTILQSMNIHNDSSQLQSQACTVLVALVDHDFSHDVECKNLQHKMLELPTIDAVLRALKLYGQGNVNLQLSVAVFLTNAHNLLLCRSNSNVALAAYRLSSPATEEGRQPQINPETPATAVDVTAAFGGGLSAMKTIWRSLKVINQ